ncbi:galactoside 2-alpha-L-fucosyltransferase Sec1-like, partial [Littorina saxatilis]|uniref:galactoside 2-alpha-L-fucosyltransferase Sec1-like n=1 Tax=Littorina saxatilis TaxID=31220 RepID=UPI0038B6944A
MASMALYGMYFGINPPLLRHSGHQIMAVGNSSQDLSSFIPTARGHTDSFSPNKQKSTAGVTVESSGPFAHTLHPTEPHQASGQLLLSSPLGGGKPELENLPFGSKPGIQNPQTGGNGVVDGSGKRSLQKQPPPPPSQPPPSKLLCIKFTGRLGNQMFQYAAVLGIARRQNRISMYGASSDLSSSVQHPPVTPNAAQYSGRCRAAKRQWESSCCQVDNALLNLDPQLDYTIGQYLQSWKYFEGFEDEVKDAMRFKDSIQSRVDKTIAQLRKENSNKTLVGVHVRRGDYLRDLHVRMGYRTAPASYFKEAMSFMRKRFGSVAFFVSTDDQKWFRDSVTSDNDVIVLKRGGAAGDMALLASLDHVII